jgi:hypothetical protein
MYRSAAENKKRQSCRVNKSGDGVNMADDCLPSAKSTRCVLADKHRKSRMAVKKAKVALSTALKAASPKASSKAAKVAKKAVVEAAAASSEVVVAAEKVEAVKEKSFKAFSPLKITKKKRRNEAERLQDGGMVGRVVRAAPVVRTAASKANVDVFKTKIGAIGAFTGLGVGLATKAHNAEINQRLAELKSEQSLVRNKLYDDRDNVHKLIYAQKGQFEKMFSNSPNKHAIISKPVLPPNHPKYTS